MESLSAKDSAEDADSSTFSNASIIAEDSPDTRQQRAHGALRERTALSDQLRIELPKLGNLAYGSLTSAEAATPTTATCISPQTAIYRTEAAAFPREAEQCTAATLIDAHERESAMALLQADVSVKGHQPPLMHTHSTSRIPSASPLSLTISNSFELNEVPKKKPPLQQLFITKSRKPRSTLSSSSNAMAATIIAHSTDPPSREGVTRYDLTSGADHDAPQHSHALSLSGTSGNGLGQSQLDATGVAHGSGVVSPLPPPSGSRQMGSPGSSERIRREASGVVSPLPRASLSSPAAAAADSSDAETSTDALQGIEMEAVLRDASRVRGIRLTWLLYLMVTMVMVLFILVLVQIVYASNRTLTRTAKQAVRTQSSTLLNSVDLQSYSLTNVLILLRDIGLDSFNSSSATYAVVRKTFCSRIYGGPIAFAMYNVSGHLVWNMSCATEDVSSPVYELPATFLPGEDALQLADYTWNIALASRTFYSTVGDDSVETYVMLMDKATLGRTLLGNNMAEYSSATLQYVTAAFLMFSWKTHQPSIMFHTLTKDTPTYVSTENGSISDAMVALFEDICYDGSPYVWHSVSIYTQPSDSSSTSSGIVSDTSVPLRSPSGTRSGWPTTVTSPIPNPHTLYSRAWGQLSVANLCSVQCYGNLGDTTCAYDNPTNVWFVVEYSMEEQNGLATILNAVGAISITAIIIFSVLMFIVHLSITVPIHFLRFQLLKTVGAGDPLSPFQRKLVRWTYRLWLGDVTAIVRSIHILNLCFRLNKRYVPDHVLRIHAAQLYLRRRTFSFLDEVDLKDDTTHQEDSDSENEAEQPLVNTAGILPSPPGRFLWRFPGATADGGKEEAVSFQQQQQLLRVTTSSREFPSVAVAVPSAGGDDAGGLHSFSCLFDNNSSSRFLKNSVAGKHGAANAGAARAVSMPDSSGAVAFPELDATLQDGEASMVIATGSAAAAAATVARGLNAMTIRREFESTILCVRIPSVALAYLLNYATASRQHRRVMRILLHCIRRHKGVLFHCSGDCIGAVWNAFEGCANHAETAAICAQEVANAFAQMRLDGLHVGIVLHQGVLVCGTVEYSKMAFITAFGEGPREALALADLATTVGEFNILVTEPVKQELCGLYDCNIVDVIQLSSSAHPLLLFELGDSRSLQLVEPVVGQMPLRVQFAVEYARAFAQFRNHEFTEALQTVAHIRCHLAAVAHLHLLRRLEQLCLFYATDETAIPYPYIRHYPVWVNYEAVAQAGLRNDPRFLTLRNNSLLSRTGLDGLVYKGVPAIRDDVDYIQDFKQELQEKMRLTARRGGFAGSGGSPLLDETSSKGVLTPRPSPPLQPTAAPTAASDRALSTGSTAELLDQSLCATPAGRHADPVSWDSVPLPPELPTPPPATPATIVPPLSALHAPPPISPSSGAGSPLTPAAAMREDSANSHGDTMHSSLYVDHSPRDPQAFSSRFSMTHRVTDEPPIALASNASMRLELPMAAGAIAASLSRDSHSESIIQSAGMSFRESVSAHTRFSVNQATLPPAIRAKNGTTYLRSRRILGRGSFGCVYLGMDSHSGRLVAIKFLPLPRDESGMEEIEVEVLILQHVKDMHVVQLVSYAFEADTIVIVMECMLAGSLQNMISAFRTIPSSTARVFMRDVLRGLSKIHSMGVIHRDMKPQNVLLSLSGSCKISDFGASAYLQELARKESRGEVCGTPVYLAPEAARGSPAKESDIWSCGIMFLQMITGELPYPHAQLSAGATILVFQIGSGIAVPQIPDTLDELNEEFVRACLHVEPSQRLTASALLQLPIFTV